MDQMASIPSRTEVIIGEAMNGVGSEYYNRVKAETAVRRLIRSLMGLGYPEPKAVEVAEGILERGKSVV